MTSTIHQAPGTAPAAPDLAMVPTPLLAMSVATADPDSAARIRAELARRTAVQR